MSQGYCVKAHTEGRCDLVSQEACLCREPGIHIFCGQNINNSFHQYVLVKYIPGMKKSFK